MSDFIVLGIIPGTNIQIGLIGWAIITLIVVAVYRIVRHESRARTLRFLSVQLSLILAVRRPRRSS